MALYPFVLNGVTFNLSDFAGMNYLTGVPAALEQLIRQAIAKYGQNLSNTPTFTTGSKSLTGLQNGLFAVGDYVLCYGVGFTAQMSGTVTVFNPVTGAMTVVMDAASGAGTGTTAIVKLGETEKLRNLTSALEPLYGGTGAGGTFTRTGADLHSVFGSARASMGASAWDAMVQIYDELVAAPESISGGQSFMHNQQNTPWYVTNASPTMDLGVGPTDGGIGKSAVGIYLAINALSSQSAIMTYGDNGFLSCGRGRIVYDTVIRLAYDAKGAYRFGLKAEGSSRAINIFSYGGIGFELLPQNGGKFNYYVGANGVANRGTIFAVSQGPINTSYARFSFETDQEGTQVDFYINGAKCATYVGDLPNAQSNYKNLLYPAYEVSAVSGTAINGMLIDTIETRKSLSR